MSNFMKFINSIPHLLFWAVSTIFGGFVGYLQQNSDKLADPANWDAPHLKPILIGMVFAGLGSFLAQAKASWLKSIASTFGVPSALSILTLSLVCLFACTKAQVQGVVTISYDAFICIMNHSTDKPEQIALECGLATAECIAIPATCEPVQGVVKILGAHKAASLREKYMSLPDGGN